MSRLLKVLGIISTAAFLLSCSFSKEDGTPAFETVEKNIPELSKIQNEMISAVRERDVDALKTLSKQARISDFDFKNSEITPMSEALRTQNLEMVRDIISLKIAPFNLGNETNNFNKRALYISLKAELARLKHLDSEKIVVNLTPAEQVLYDEQIRILRLHMTKSVLERANKIDISNISCGFIEGTFLTSMAYSDSDEPTQVLEIIRSLNCSNSLPTAEIQKIYQLELIRQFRKLFSQKDVLRYIISHVNFANDMWNIDESDIWVSPILLFRISLSTEHKRKYLNDYSEMEFLDYPSGLKFSTDLGLKPPKFELVNLRSKDGRHSYVYFQIQSINGEDIFFRKVSAFMHGKKYYRLVESKIKDGGYEEAGDEHDWEVVLQQFPSDVVD